RPYAGTTHRYLMRLLRRVPILLNFPKWATLRTGQEKKLNWIVLSNGLLMVVTIAYLVRPIITDIVSLLIILSDTTLFSDSRYNAVLAYRKIRRLLSSRPRAGGCGWIQHARRSRSIQIGFAYSFEPLVLALPAGRQSANQIDATLHSATPPTR